jgi:hypothetical protein
MAGVSLCPCAAWLPGNGVSGLVGRRPLSGRLNYSLLHSRRRCTVKRKVMGGQSRNIGESVIKYRESFQWWIAG